MVYLGWVKLERVLHFHKKNELGLVLMVINST